MGGGQGTLITSSFLPRASVVDSKISTLRLEHSYCSSNEQQQNSSVLSMPALHVEDPVCCAAAG
jgi:hypothetical protein